MAPVWRVHWGWFPHRQLRAICHCAFWCSQPKARLRQQGTFEKPRREPPSAGKVRRIQRELHGTRQMVHAENCSQLSAVFLFFAVFLSGFSSRPWRNLPPTWAIHMETRRPAHNTLIHMDFLPFFLEPYKKSTWIGVLWAGLRVSMWIAHVGANFAMACRKSHWFSLVAWKFQSLGSAVFRCFLLFFAFSCVSH